MAADRLLAVDIGNTNITIGAFQGRELRRRWRLTSHPHRTHDEYGAILAPILERADFHPDRIILGSVVPALEVEWERLGLHNLGVKTRAIKPNHPPVLTLSVDNPQEVGVDRIVDSWAASQKHPPPLLVLDFGTATTFDVVGPEGDYQGGLILPGLELAAESLFRRTALLPQVAVRKPEELIGRNTVDCIQSGLYHGWLEMTAGLVRRFREKFDRKLTVISTGGLAETFAEDSEFVDHVEPDLTLEGLRGIDQIWDDSSRAGR